MPDKKPIRDDVTFDPYIRCYLGRDYWEGGMSMHVPHGKTYPPPGWHPARLVEVFEQKTRYFTQNPPLEVPGLHWDWLLLGEEGQQCIVPSWTSTRDPRKARFLAQHLRALGFTGRVDELDTDTLIGKVAMVRVGTIEVLAVRKMPPTE